MSKTVLITGATSGIGEATARLFAQKGCRLILTGRREDRLNEVSDKIKILHKVEVLPLCFDVRKFAEVKQAIESIPGEWTKIDILVNNAGLAAGLSPIQEGSFDDWEQMIDTNIKGLLYVTRLIVPGMIKNGHGHIVNIGSIAGKEAYANGNVYCATKSAVDALTKSMRIDLVQHGIKVTQIAPGAIETEFSLVRFKGDSQRAASVYKGFEPLHAGDIADAIWYVTSLPAHVTINDLVIMPTAQANATTIHRKTE
jgi:3-hydroxy acid dehydrogenase / malonic semialdehyde reductase